MIGRYYDKAVNKLTGTLTGIALDKFIKSEYLRDTTSILPLTLLCMITRGTFNFLIVSRIKSNIYILDFFISLLVTIILSFLSPHIYNSISKTYNEEIKNFSQFVIDSYWIEGWSFIEKWKTIIFGSLGLFTIFSLFFIEVNSRMIQEFIFHMMISSAIVDYLTKLKDEIIKRKVKDKNSPLPVRIIEKPQTVLSRASTSYSNLEILKNGKNITVLDYTFLEDYNRN